MTTHPAAIPTATALIQEFEGCHLQAYLCPAGVWTIGWGNTRHLSGRAVAKGDTITQADADRYLSQTVAEIAQVLARTVPHWPSMSANQQAALISFGYNFGWHFYGSGRSNTLDRALKNQDWPGVAAALKLYTNQGLAGLVRRRQREADLFLSGVQTVTTPSPTPRSGNRLDVPYFSQHDNRYEPWRTCNITSIAMCLWFLGIRGDGSYPQLEDQLYRRCQQNNWDFQKPGDLKKLAESYPGVRNDFTETGTLQDIRDAIDQGKPCVVHGMFTGSGHIIVIFGYDSRGFHTHDPAGEWFPVGIYEYNSRQRPDRGKDLHYSNRLIGSAGHAWEMREATDYYNNWTAQQVEQTPRIWLHRLSRRA